MPNLKVNFTVILLLTLSKFACANSLVEEPLKKGVNSMVEQQLDKAILQISDLAEKYPNFKLAQYIKADLLTYRSGQHFKKAPGIISDDIYKELKARLAEDSVIRENLYPSEILYLGKKYPYVIVADISKPRLYVYNNGMGLVNSFYISIGRAGAGKEKVNDGKTPLGTYFIDKRIEGDLLPDKYGALAFTLNYPNAWDKLHGKTGYGIWLHGTAPDLYSRAPKATEGCISLANDDLKMLSQYIVENTPVIIGNPVKWSRKRVAFNNQEFIKTFNAANKGASQLAENKRNQYDFSLLPKALASEAEVPLDNISLISGPENDMIIATFLQQAKDKVSRIEQYWKNTGSGWKMISESRL